jgi:hypothetical protein
VNEVPLDVLEKVDIAINEHKAAGKKVSVAILREAEALANAAGVRYRETSFDFKAMGNEDRYMFVKESVDGVATATTQYDTIKQFGDVVARRHSVTMAKFDFKGKKPAAKKATSTKKLPVKRSAPATASAAAAPKVKVPRGSTVVSTEKIRGTSISDDRRVVEANMNRVYGQHNAVYNLNVFVDHDGLGFVAHFIATPEGKTALSKETKTRLRSQIKDALAKHGLLSK